MSSSEPTPTTDAETFFDALGRRGYEPLVRKVTGRVRFDVADGPDTDSWVVAIKQGDISVSREKGEADCTMRGDKTLFDNLAKGEANAMSSVLRGALLCTGEVDLLIAVQRLFPAPPRKTNPTSMAGSTR